MLNERDFLVIQIFCCTFNYVFMKRSTLCLIADAVATGCLALFTVSYFVGETAALVCLIVACIGMLETLLISFIQRRYPDVKMVCLMLFLLFLGRLFYVADVVTVANLLFFAVFVIGCVLVARFVWYMNKYCRKDADKYLDA